MSDKADGKMSVVNLPGVTQDVIAAFKEKFPDIELTSNCKICDFCDVELPLTHESTKCAVEGCPTIFDICSECILVRDQKLLQTCHKTHGNTEEITEATNESIRNLAIDMIFGHAKNNPGKKFRVIGKKESECGNVYGTVDITIEQLERLVNDPLIPMDYILEKINIAIREGALVQFVYYDDGNDRSPCDHCDGQCTKHLAIDITY